MPITIVEGDITSAKVDAIVNAANPKMLGGGGVDGAIHKAAGPKLLEACRQIKSVNGIRCPFGEARITSAGDLQAKYVIHAVGPIYRNEARPEQVLENAYSNALQLAVDNGCQSIAFPAISCGAYGYPIEEAANIAIQVCRQHASLDIRFYFLDHSAMRIWDTTLEAM